MKRNATTHEEKIAELAREAAEHLTTATRDNGTEYIRKDDTTPEWVTEIIYTAHGDLLPDDHRYQFIHEALTSIADNDGDREAAQDSQEPEIYISNLTGWLASHNARAAYCDEVSQEFGQFDSIINLLQAAHLQERNEVLNAVYNALSEHANQTD